MNEVEDDDGTDRAGSGNSGVNGVEDDDGMERAGGGNGGMDGVKDNNGTGCCTRLGMAVSVQCSSWLTMFFVLGIKSIRSF